MGGFGGNGNDGVDVMGHVGGLLTGIIAGFSIYEPIDPSRIPNQNIAPTSLEDSKKK